MINFYWSPFKLNGFTQNETLEIIKWSIEQVNIVCNADLKFSNKRFGVEVQGMNTNAYAGKADSNDIWLSTIRPMYGRDRFVAGGICLHEIGHTQVFRWKHNNSSQRNLMHSWGPIDDWFAPHEVTAAQNRRGEPKRKFWPHELTYLGKELRERRQYINDLIAIRNKSKDVPHRRATHQKILTQWDKYRRDANKWYEIVRIWRDEKWARTPDVVLPRYQLQQTIVRTGEPICAS